MSYAKELGHLDAVYDSASEGSLKDEERANKLLVSSTNKGDKGVVLTSSFNTSKFVNGVDVEICVVLVKNNIKILIDKEGLQELEWLVNNLFKHSVNNYVNILDSYKYTVLFWGINHDKYQGGVNYVRFNTKNF